jgi:hypothetical protein
MLSVQSPEPRTHAVRSPGSSSSDAPPAGGATTASQLFSQHILQHDLIQRQLGYKLFQFRVLLAKLLDLAHLIHFQACILRIPASVLNRVLQKRRIK